MASLKDLHAQTPLIFRDNPAIQTYAQDTMFQGTPEGVLRARDIQEVKEALQFCNKNKIPVTFCGSQTSMTGASVANEGLLIATTKLEKIFNLDVSTKNHFATAITEPGITISNLKKEVAKEGWFYPPAPTSQDDARLGATVSTNATGEDSFQYGTTRKYIRELKVLLADGTEKIFARKPKETPSDLLNRGGYFLESKNPIDWVIGGEGTLGFIYEITVDLILQPPGFFSALAPFPHTMNAIDFAIDVVTNSHLSPRALELIDTGALQYMKSHPTFPSSLKEAQALIYFKQEYEDEKDFEKLLNQWMGAIQKFSTPPLSDNTLVATTEKQKEEMRLWRHHIPSSINEEYRHYWNQGGGKVGSDWWVPISKLKGMMDYVYQTGKEAGIPFMAYAHIGKGHPHVNYLCKTPSEKKKGEQLLLLCCKKAVSLGGGVCGEHGIGKLHHNLLAIQWNKKYLEQMRRIKKEWDPHWILGRGNILKTPPSK